MEWLEPFRLTLKALLLPPGGIIILLLLGFWFRNYFVGKFLVAVSTILLYLLSTPAVTYWIAGHVETTQAMPADEIKRIGSQALLVLSASADLENPEIGGRDRPSGIGLQRLNYALQLHRQTGLPVIVSGGKLTSESPPLAAIYAKWLNDQGVETLALETASANSWENIGFSKPILEELDVYRVAIVTHAYHMPRAMQAARAHRLDAIAAPFGFIHKRTEGQTIGRTARDWVPYADRLAANYLLLHELSGRWWYQFKEAPAAPAEAR